ncbi:MAG: sensor histidine kinase [Candidatus Flexifilum sp.]
MIANGVSLRWRLFLSYLLLLGVTLGVITVAFLVIINTRPAPIDATFRQLAEIAADLPLRRLWTNAAGRRLLPIEQQIQDLAANLRAFADDHGVRLLLFNQDTRLLLWDSAGTYLRGQTVRASFQPYPLPEGLPVRGPGIPGGLIQATALAGVLLNPDNSEWLFVGLETLISRLLEQNYLLVLAVPRPTLNLGAALRAFGTDVMPVLMQAFVVGLLIALLLAGVISRSIAQPLLNVARAAAAIAAGQHERDVPLEGPEEVRAVAAAFNRMSAEVRAEQQSQQDLLANVSHDLKTPLTSIQGYSQAIIDGAAPDPVAAARIIYEEAARLTRMVTELTDLARIQAGRLSMTMQPIDPGALTAAVSERLRIVAQKKQIELHVEAPAMPFVSGDGDRLAQVLVNLISNAIQYTPPGGHIWVRARPRGGGVEISVQDTGIGIAAEDLPRIFERFYQVDKTRSSRRGTGLGLAIVKEILNAHGGTITATSPGEGLGSTFIVWLPAMRAQPPARRRS